MVDFARRHAWEEPHYRKVTSLALSQFNQMASLHQLGAAKRELLKMAGLLHDVGLRSPSRPTTSTRYT